MARHVGVIKMLASKPLDQAIKTIDLTYPDQIERNAIKRAVMVVRADRKRGIEHTTASISQLYAGSVRAAQKYYRDRGMLFDGNVYYNAVNSLHKLHR